MMLKRPDAGCSILGYRFGVVGDLVPALAQARILEECHCLDDEYDVANIEALGG